MAVSSRARLSDCACGHCALLPCSCALHHTCKSQQIDLPCSGAQQRPGRGIGGGARGQHIIHQHDALALKPGFCSRRHLEGALQVVAALRLCQAHLRPGALDARQCAECERHTMVARNRLRQQRRLVEAPRPQPEPVQRHRHDQVSLVEQLAAGTRHHPAHGQCQLGPVAIFQPVDELARRVIIAADGPCPLEHRRIGHGSGRNQLPAKIDLEGRAQPLAIGPLDEAHATPASRAQRLRFARRCRAGDA